MSLMNADKTLTCSDCGQPFTFTASEQEFYAERGFTEPRRCADLPGGPQGPAWRQRRRQLQQRRRLRQRRRLQQRRRRRLRLPRGPREMFPATCSSCGQETEVPFRPTSGKPVYCSACFAQRRA